MTALVRLPHLSISWLRVTTVVMLIVVGTGAGVLPAIPLSPATAQTAAVPGQPLRLESDIQEANALTGVITARGNVRINYPARQIQATSVQAQYYSRERRIVLSGDVYILQEGNSIRGEVVTYLIDEGRFVALPNQGAQVEAIYIVPDPNPVASTLERLEQLLQRLPSPLTLIPSQSLRRLSVLEDPIAARCSGKIGSRIT